MRVMHVLWTINQPQTPAGWVMRNYWEEWGPFKPRDGAGQILCSMDFLKGGIVVIVKGCVCLYLSMCMHVYPLVSLTNSLFLLKHAMYSVICHSSLRLHPRQIYLFSRWRRYVTTKSIPDYRTVTRLKLSTSVRLYLTLWFT